MNCDEIVSGLILEFRRGTGIRRKRYFDRRQYIISSAEKIRESRSAKK